MIDTLLYINLAFIITMLMLIFFGKSPWVKALSHRLLITLIIIEIVLYSIVKEINILLDIAIVFAVIGFVDVQFLSVFLRKKGDL